SFPATIDESSTNVSPAAMPPTYGALLAVTVDEMTVSALFVLIPPYWSSAVFPEMVEARTITVASDAMPPPWPLSFARFPVTVEGVRRRLARSVTLIPPPKTPAGPLAVLPDTVERRIVVTVSRAHV